MAHHRGGFVAARRAERAGDRRGDAAAHRAGRHLLHQQRERQQYRPAGERRGALSRGESGFEQLGADLQQREQRRRSGQPNDAPEQRRGARSGGESAAGDGGGGASDRRHASGDGRRIDAGRARDDARVRTGSRGGRPRRAHVRSAPAFRARSPRCSAAESTRRRCRRCATSSRTAFHASPPCRFRASGRRFRG